ncbi:Tn3 family transposase [Francisella noatunensis]
MSFIFYGKLGELRNNKTQEQGISILCLHLLQVCMFYINTLIIQNILYKKDWNGVFTGNDYRASNSFIVRTYKSIWTIPYRPKSTLIYRRWIW